MLNHKLLDSEGILVLELDSALAATDFEAMACEIDPYIVEYGKLSGLMIHAKGFLAGETSVAFRAHIQLVEHHIKDVQKIAFATDNIPLNSSATAH